MLIVYLLQAIVPLDAAFSGAPFPIWIDGRYLMGNDRFVTTPRRRQP